MLLCFSDGISQTGTFIALDVLLYQAAVKKSVDVPACVYKLRYNRMNMIPRFVSQICKMSIIILCVTTMWMIWMIFSYNELRMNYISSFESCLSVYRNICMTILYSTLLYSIVPGWGWVVELFTLSIDNMFNLSFCIQAHYDYLYKAVYEGITLGQTTIETNEFHDYLHDDDFTSNAGKQFLVWT